MKLECPECGGELYHHIDIDIDRTHRINKDGTFDIIRDRDNSSGSVYCKNDETHMIPNELFENVMSLIKRGNRY